MFQQQTFLHHEFVFLLETEGWSNENAGRIAMNSMRHWTHQHDPDETAALYVLLMQQSEAIVHEMDFDYDKRELPSVRSAQRSAIVVGIGKRKLPSALPMICLEAFAVADGQTCSSDAVASDGRALRSFAS